MQRKGASLEEVYDVRALRIIVKNKVDCYAALREVERLWKPVDGRFKVRRARMRPQDACVPLLSACREA
jgi:GTP pyrophosphokinase